MGILQDLFLQRARLKHRLPLAVLLTFFAAYFAALAAVGRAVRPLFVDPGCVNVDVLPQRDQPGSETGQVDLVIISLL